jgi:hypothetical protein
MSRLPNILLVALWVSALGFFAPVARDLAAGTPLGVNGPCDFVVFWVAGRMQAAQADVYDFSRVVAWQAQNLAPGTVQNPFMYPPPVLLVLPAVAKPGLLPAFLSWDGLSLLVAVALLRLAGLGWLVVAAACCCPAALLNFALGQFGLITGAVAVAAIARAEAAPILAGGLAGLLLIKPQAGVILPVALARRWRGLMAAALCVAVLVGVSVAVDGAGVWRSFLREGWFAPRAMFAGPFPAGGTSVLWMCRSFGFGVRVSLAAQGVASLLAMAVGFRAWGVQGADPAARLALTACLGVIAAPFGFSYDLCGCSAAVAACAWAERRVALADALLWTWPVLGLMVSRYAGLELTPLVLGAAAARAARAMGWGRGT